MAESLPKLVQIFSAEFDDMCAERHTTGQLKYGQFSFLEKDMINEALAEITDFANYMRYAFIKLRLLQMALASDPRVEALATTEGDITIGVESFHPNSGS